MLEKNIDIAPLFLKYLDNLLSADEHEQLMQWVKTSDTHRKLFLELQEPEKIQEYLEQYSLIDPQAAFSTWKNDQPGGYQKAMKNHVSTSPTHRVHFLKKAWFRYAAAIICLLATGAYLWFQNSSRPQTFTSDNKHLPTDIAPGKDGAILTLADGTEVVLDSLGNGVVAMQNGVQAAIKDGELVYEATGKAVENMVYNTMSTPKGRQFNLRLPDGTRVWLNAASSLRYPTRFSGADRRVEISGEAYFEVAQNAKQPFKVSVNGQAEIEVLGTSFNVNAYENEESINTTLIEGSLRVNDVVIKPGQQAQIVNAVGGRSEDATTKGLVGQKTQAGIMVVNDADIEKVMAWKNGVFNFQDKSLEEVMRQLERWYDIEVVYEKGIPDIRFGGEISRGVSLAGLITGLEASEVHFRIEEGRRLVVMP